MTRRAGLSWPVFSLSAAIGIAIFILAMIVIGTRLDTGPTLPDEPSAAEQVRQDAASAYSLLADAAENDPDYLAIGTMARAHEDAVGGVWIPWPEGAPEDATNPPAPHSDSTDVIDLLGEGIAATEAALQEADSSDTVLYASILLRQQVAYNSVASADDEEPSGGMSAEQLSPDQLGEIAGESLVIFDTARQWLETAAPHLDGNDRALQRIADLDAYTAAILDAGAADEREAFAAVPQWFLDDPSPETAARLEEEAYRLVLVELFTYVPTKEGLDAEIVATALEFVSPAIAADLPDLPFLDPKS